MIQVITGDCLDAMRGMGDNSVDLVFTSPPYEDARMYSELQFKLAGQEWVDWALERYVESQRVCRGLVAWVVEGRTKKFRWSATPALLMADLHRSGVKLRKPPAFVRHGISGSGGPDWLRNDWEFCICSSKGRLPWSDNTAMGWPCKYPNGGAFSNRTANDQRANPDRKKQGNNGRPAITNPGNVIQRPVGKGHMGSDIAHETEAPFPESLAEFFVKSFCPPEGTTLDCFGGSGTVAAVCEKAGRNAITIDSRKTQSEITSRRLREVRRNDAAV